MNETLKILQQEGRCFVDEPLSLHCSIGVGGKAKIVVLPKSLEQLVEIVSYCKGEKIRYIVVGNMTNLVFDDAGFDGVVVSTKKIDENFAVWNNTITCGSGAMLSKLAAVAARYGLSGLEWACGIPGTVGGAVVQNAGAFERSMSGVVKKVLVLDDRKLATITNKECEFSYRDSVFKHSKKLILDVSFGLQQQDKRQVEEKMKFFIEKRAVKQPKGRSAGSVFKNPDGLFAGELLEKAGLRGKKLGGAMFSDKHANFIVNFDNASFFDVAALIDEARERVYNKFGVWLEKEIELVGKD